MGPISARSPGTLLQDGILLMADKLNKCRSALEAFGSLCLVLFLEKKLKAGHRPHERNTKRDPEIYFTS